MALLAGGAALGTSLYNAFGGGPSASNVNIPQPYQLPGMGTAASGALAPLANYPGANMGGWSVPLAQTTGTNLYNNPYAGGYQAGAGTAGALGQGAATTAYGAGGGLISTGQGDIAAAQPFVADASTIMNLGLDPQSALYARTLQQVQDQTRAGNLAAGVGTTPYGAGIEAQNVSNFNIDWQNQALQRAAAGAQGASTAAGIGTNLTQTGAGLVGQGAGLQAAAPGQYLTASGMPYGAYEAIGTGQYGALTGAQNVASGAQGLYQAPITGYQQYLGIGNQANQVANQNYQLQLAQQNAAFNQMQTNYGNIGAGISGIGGAFGGGTGWGAPSQGYNVYGGATSGGPGWGASSVTYPY